MALRLALLFPCASVLLLLSGCRNETPRPMTDAGRDSGGPMHGGGPTHGGYSNHAPERVRKLLLHKREILRLGGKATEKGLTLVPLRAYFKNGRIKVEIGLARGKREHDKRDAIKKKDLDREARQESRSRRS